MPLGDGSGPPWWRGKFRGCGYRFTIPRQTILAVLSRAKKHLSAEEIYIQVHKDFPAVGLTTVYRTLELLAEMGLVFKFDFGDGRARYELSKGSKEEDHHHHLVCTNCSRVVDYNDFIKEEKELLDKAEKGLSKKFNFKINDHIIQFYGLCDKCRTKQ